MAGRKLERPWLGAKLDAVTREMAEAMGLARVAGAIVARLYDKSPAAEAGLRSGRRDPGRRRPRGRRRRAVQYRLTTRGIGNRCHLDVVRKGRQLSVDVALRAAPQAGKDDVRKLCGARTLRRARR